MKPKQIRLKINFMIKKLPFLLLAAAFLLPFKNADAQKADENVAIDQIVAVVNDHTILESDVNQRVRQYLFQQQQNKQQVRFSKELWYSTLNNMVEQYVLFDNAKIDSITVSDEQVDRQIEQRIQQIVSQLGSREALEEQLGKTLLEVKADLRKQYRKEIIIQQYRNQKISNVRITRPEVIEFFNQIPADSLPEVPEQVAISQIVAIPPPNEHAEKQAFKLAEELRDSIINYGKSMEELARKYSDAPGGKNGGKIPLISIDELVPPYAAAAAALKPGEVSKVVKTDFGYHIIRLNERRGDMIDTNHILIKIDKNSYDKEVAIKKLNAIRDTIKSNPDTTFAEIAREESEDPNTADQGGKILQSDTGDKLLKLSDLNPSLYRIVLLLREGDISNPKPYNIGEENNTKPAYRIVRLDKQIPAHTASLETDYNLIKSYALRQKKMRVMRNWMKDLEEQVYIDYKIPVPSYLKQSVSIVNNLEE